MRVGMGYDVHRLVEGRKLILCGVEIPWSHGLLGHSDADVALHALMDAMLGAGGLGDIGRHFPDTDDRFKDISSLLLLKETNRLINAAGFAVHNTDITIVAQKPKLLPFIPQMVHSVAEALVINESAVNVKATTTEKLGFEGREDSFLNFRELTDLKRRLADDPEFMEYVKAHADSLNIDYRIFDHWNIHIHVPEGATPKDGPSAGITIATSIASALTQRKVRKNTAMTGEITLRGKVLPVGGIKEKILAAKRAGITDIVMCRENEKDILEIPEVYLKGVKFHYVENVQDVWNFALTDEIVKNPLDLTVKEEEDKKQKKD